jgi:hypothetical protein
MLLARRFSYNRDFRIDSTRIRSEQEQSVALTGLRSSIRNCGGARQGCCPRRKVEGRESAKANRIPEGHFTAESADVCDFDRTILTARRQGYVLPAGMN